MMEGVLNRGQGPTTGPGWYMTPRRHAVAGGATLSYLTGLKLWLKADAIAGLVDNDPVGTWVDASGLGNDATQATASKKPTFKTGILNGKPGVKADGVDDVMLTPTGIVAARPWTIFSLHKQLVGSGRSLSGQGANSLIGNHGNYTNRLYLEGWVLMGTEANAGAVLSIATGVAGPVNTFWQNGVLLITDSSSGYTGSWDGFRLFNNSTESQPLNGYLFEVLAYDHELSESNRLAVQGYLSTKYGLGI